MVKFKSPKKERAAVLNYLSCMGIRSTVAHENDTLLVAVRQKRPWNDAKRERLRKDVALFTGRLIEEVEIR